MELIEGLSNDSVLFPTVFPKHISSKTEAHMLSYMSLHAILCGYKQPE